MTRLLLALAFALQAAMSNSGPLWSPPHVNRSIALYVQIDDLPMPQRPADEVADVVIAADLPFSEETLSKTICVLDARDRLRCIPYARLYQFLTDGKQ